MTSAGPLVNSSFLSLGPMRPDELTTLMVSRAAHLSLRRGFGLYIHTPNTHAWITRSLDPRISYGCFHSPLFRRYSGENGNQLISRSLQRTYAFHIRIQDTTVEIHSQFGVRMNTPNSFYRKLYGLINES